VIATRSKSACLRRRRTIGMRQLLIASSTAARRWYAAHLIATMAFSRMDSVKGDSIRGWQSKQDYVFGGVRNVLDNQISKSVTQTSAVRQSATKTTGTLMR
jgi:hypothetical protein